MISGDAMRPGMLVLDSTLTFDGNYFEGDKM
jgi:hypothetical protein